MDNHFSQDGYSVARRHPVDDGECHRDEGKQRHHRQPNLEAGVVAKEAGALEIIHGEDDQGGDEEELHVAHQVPRLAQAVTTSGDVGYGRYVCMTSAFRKEGVSLKQTKGREVAGSDW